MAMNTNAIGPNGPSDDELLAGVRRRMAAVESLVPLPGAWTEAGVGFGTPVRVGVRSRIGFAGLAPLVLVAALVVVAVGVGFGGRQWGGGGTGASDSSRWATIIYQLTPAIGQQITDAELDSTVAIMRARLSAMSITTATVEKLLPDRVSVHVVGDVQVDPLPGNVMSVRGFLNSTYRLEFVPLPPETYGTSAGAGSVAVPSRGYGLEGSPPALLSGSDVDPSGVAAAIDPGSDGWALTLHFKPQAAATFKSWTETHINEYLAIVMDGTVLAVPYIRAQVSDGAMTVSGVFTEADARWLADVIRIGPLPVPVQEASYTASYTIDGQNGVPAATSAVAPIVAPDVVTPTDIPSSGRTLGNAGAPVTLDLYGDFQCSACRSFMEDTEVRLIDNYVRQGKLKIVYHDFVVIDSMNGSHDSENAADAARIAADQGKFWVFSDYLWANQQNEQAGEFSRDRLIEIARLSGLDVAKFTADLDAGKYLAEVRAESATGHPAGVTGTPTILVNGTQVGAVGTVPDYTTISAAIDRSLASASPSATAQSTATASSSASAFPTPVASPFATDWPAASPGASR
jgi:protein-disulfide isomerase